jgi:predicted RND superfamily exporter protein
LFQPPSPIAAGEVLFHLLSLQPRDFGFDLSLTLLGASTMSALSDFFTIPVILGFLTAIIFLIGLISLINIAMKKDGSKDGRTIPM